MDILCSDKTGAGAVGARGRTGGMGPPKGGSIGVPPAAPHGVHRASRAPACAPCVPVPCAGTLTLNKLTVDHVNCYALSDHSVEDVSGGALLPAGCLLRCAALRCAAPAAAAATAACDDSSPAPSACPLADPQVRRAVGQHCDRGADRHGAARVVPQPVSPAHHPPEPVVSSHRQGWL